jgi:hypothetical protein
MIHKHAVEIIAWAGGEEIQYYDAIMCRWADDKNPKWDEETKFRVKPEPKPDVVVQYYADKNNYSVYPAMYFDRIPNLKLTFDGETGELKSAEVLK